MSDEYSVRPGINPAAIQGILRTVTSVILAKARDLCAADVVAGDDRKTLGEEILSMKLLVNDLLDTEQAEEGFDNAVELAARALNLALQLTEFAESHQIVHKGEPGHPDLN